MDEFGVSPYVTLAQSDLIKFNVISEYLPAKYIFLKSAQGVEINVSKKFILCTDFSNIPI